MQRVSSDRHVFAFAPDLEPALRVSPGSQIVFETLDSWAGRLRTPEDIHVVPADFERSNPATGPVYVDGAMPGDALVLEINQIVPLLPVISKIVPSGGLLAGEVASPYCRFIPIDGDHLVFPGGVRLPLRPMIGVIGTAPAAGRRPTIDPGDHGGNMDHNHIAPGSRVYLPIAVPGALFALGDVHAAMGDGEVAGAGLDCPSEVTLVVDVLKAYPIARPLIETPTEWITCASAANVQEAIRVATRDMVAFVSQHLGVSREDAFLLVSAAGDVRIGQACGSTIDSTARMVFPKVRGVDLRRR